MTERLVKNPHNPFEGRADVDLLVEALHHATKLVGRLEEYGKEWDDVDAGIDADIVRMNVGPLLYEVHRRGKVSLSGFEVRDTSEDDPYCGCCVNWRRLDLP